MSPPASLEEGFEHPQPPQPRFCPAPLLTPANPCPFPPPPSPLVPPASCRHVFDLRLGMRLANFSKDPRTGCPTGPACPPFATGSSWCGIQLLPVAVEPGRAGESQGSARPPPPLAQLGGSSLELHLCRGASHEEAPTASSLGHPGRCAALGCCRGPSTPHCPITKFPIPVTRQIQKLSGSINP